MTSEKLITSAGFTRLTKTTIKPRLILSVEGPGKVGKTHFALTSDREPILYVNLNMGLEGVSNKFVGKDIWVMDLPRGKFLIDQMGEAKAHKEAQEAWNTFSQGYRKILGTGGTVIIDTASELWELLRLSRLEKLEKVPARYYGPVNAEFEAQFQLALDQPDLTLIAVHELRDEYVNDKFTGKKLRAGYRRTEYLAQVLIRLYKLRTQKEYLEDHDKPEDWDDVHFPLYGFTVLECRHNPDLEGTTWEGDFANFPTLRDLVLA